MVFRVFLLSVIGVVLSACGFRTVVGKTTDDVTDCISGNFEQCQEQCLSKIAPSKQAAVLQCLGASEPPFKEINACLATKGVTDCFKPQNRPPPPGVPPPSSVGNGPRPERGQQQGLRAGSAVRQPKVPGFEAFREFFECHRRCLFTQPRCDDGCAQIDDKVQAALNDCFQKPPRQTKRKSNIGGNVFQCLDKVALSNNELA